MGSNTSDRRTGRTSSKVRLRPSAEALEGRSLLAAYAGSLDPTFHGTGYFYGQINAGEADPITAFDAVGAEAGGAIVAAASFGAAAGSTSTPGSPSGFAVVRLRPDGSLDPGYGRSGEARVDLPSGLTADGAPGTLLVQADGKVVVVGLARPAGSSSLEDDETVVARFDVDGSPDTSFGAGGLAVLDRSALGVSAKLTSAALAPGGSIVLVGSTPIPSTTAGQTEVAATRLDPDGSVDRSFGKAGLVAFSDLTPSELVPDSPDTEAANSVAVQPDGKLVLLGTITDFSVPFEYANQVEAFRLDADGSVDTSFAKSGFQGTGVTATYGLALRPDGQILILGDVPYLGSELVDLAPDGSLARTSSLDPILPGDAASSLALLPDGKVIVSSGFAVARLDADLAPDPTFGLGGVSKLPGIPSDLIFIGPLSVGVTPVDYPHVAVGPGGEVVLGAREGGYPATSSLAVARLTSTGIAHPGDFTGDGIADRAVYLPSLGAFAIRPSDGRPDEIIPFGTPGQGNTIPAPADYLGTGVDDIAAYLPASGAFAIRDPTTGTDRTIAFGIPGAGQTLPAPGDYFGTGVDDIAAYLPSLGAFAIRDPATNRDEIIPFGQAGAGNSIPVPGDYDGSGRTELAVYLPKLGAFAYRPAGGGPDVIAAFGIPGAGKTIPAPGDYDGTGTTELGVYLPSLGEFVYRSTIRASDVALAFGPSGAGRTLPAVADYTGAGADDLAAYLPTIGTFADRPLEQAGGSVQPSGPDVLDAFGIPGPGQSIPVIGSIPDIVALSGPSTTATAESSPPAQGVAADALDFDPALLPGKKADR